MRLRTVVVPGWPRLAWLAVCREDVVRAFVGSAVEVFDEWFCEGVWDGPFEHGDFDQTDLVFGSGVRLRGDSIGFVSAGSTVDRLHSWNGDGERCVSNSLLCLLSYAGGTLDLQVDSYVGIFSSITRGLNGYRREVPTTAGNIRLTYWHNLSWDGEELSEIPKADPHRDFSTYEAYRAFLDDSIARLAGNARAPQRRTCLHLRSTLSSGYDSTAATVIASQAGGLEAFGFDRARGGIDDDSGAPVADALGIPYHAIETTAWRSHPMAAVPFVASLTAAGSSVSWKSAEHLVKDAVVFTGFHGDKLWGTEPENLGPDLVKAELAGADLTEYRLWVGFANCPVAYWGARQVKDIHEISTSPELSPWDLVGRRYSRPVCRRMLEERAVPREAFGMKKKATAQFLLKPDNFLTREMRRDYSRWLRAHRSALIGRGETPPDRLTDLRIVARGRLGLAAARLRGRPAVKRLGSRADKLLAGIAIDFDPSKGRAYHRYVYHWAVDRAMQRYPDPRRS